MAVCGVFVCSNKADFVRNRFAHESPERIESGIFDHLAGGIALAGDRADDHRFVAQITALCVAALVPVTILIFPTDPRFVGFDFAQQLRKIIVRKHRANAMAHVEGSLVCGLLPVLFEHPLDLQGAHSFLGLANQIDDFKPERELVVRVLEHGSDERRKAIAGLLRAFVYLAGSPVHSLRAALTDPIPRAMLDSDDLAASASRAFDATPPAKADEQFHALILSFVLLVNLSKAQHEQTLHLNLFRCQVRYNRPELGANAGRILTFLSIFYHEIAPRKSKVVAGRVWHLPHPLEPI